MDCSILNFVWNIRHRTSPRWFVRRIVLTGKCSCPSRRPIGEKERKIPAGRKPSDVVFMFKVMVLQSLYNLSDDAVEYLVYVRCGRNDFGRGIAVDAYEHDYVSGCVNKSPIKATFILISRRK